MNTLNPIRTSGKYAKGMSDLDKAITAWRMSRVRSSVVEADAVKNLSLAAYKMWKYIQEQLEAWETA